MNRLDVLAQRPWIIVALAFFLIQCTDNPDPEEPVASSATSMEADVLDDNDFSVPDLPLDEDEVLDDMVDSSTPEFMDEAPQPFEGATPVYFGFDEYAITPDAEIKLAALALYLKENLDQSLKIEGHCDERGTVEYNLALGEKRALSVMNFLVNLGVDGSRITTTSMGEEMPAVAGNDPYAWSQNRRVEFILGLGL